MVTFSGLDIFIILLFFALLIVVGYLAGRKNSNEADDYLLGGRKVGLFLFILTNVATWYGGILGVGEFTYRYGIASWFTQGLPYYVFAFIFAFLLAEKIRKASLFTIPDKLTEVYGNKAGIISSLLVFILVSPAPYLLMTASLVSLIFKTSMLVSLIIALIISMLYLLKGGYRADLYTDVFQFFIMFGGFIVIVIAAYFEFGGIDFLVSKLPAEHLQLTGGASPAFIAVWFLIALWTFADPGFHQRCYAADSGLTAKKGILYSILLWALFDFLTTTTGLFARASLSDIKPVLSYPLLAEKILGSGFKGIFYAALFATIASTSNSFLFLSGTTIARDFIFRISKDKNEKNLKFYTIIGLLISGLLSVVLALSIPSVIEIWYTIGSICIPGIILPVLSSYYPKFKISPKLIAVEMLSAVGASLLWYLIRDSFVNYEFLYQLEPMIIGFFIAVLIHCLGVIALRKDSAATESGTILQ